MTNRTKSVWTVDYVTKRGYSVHFGKYGWVYVNCSPTYDLNEIREIQDEWLDSLNNR